MINEKALLEAAHKWRKVRMTDVLGRKENPCETVKSVFEKGLGGLYDDEATVYALRFGIRYYIEAAEHMNRADRVIAVPGKALENA